MNSKYDPLSIEQLKKAKTRPPGCSEQRWRMELSRRKKGYQGGPVEVISPIFIWGKSRNRYESDSK